MVKAKRRARSRKSSIMVKLYQSTNKLSGLPYKGRARKTSDKLFVFPVFDQSSSLPNLPFAIITHINSGNRDALSKLLYSHFDPNCKINLSIVSEESINIKSFFKFNSAMSDLNPDLFMCVHATKLEGNRIRASIYNKATANRLIHDVVAPTITDSFLQPMVGKNRSDFVKSAIATETKLTHDGAEVEVNDTEQDLIVYMRLEMELLVDATTKLVTHWRVDHQVTSIVPVDILSADS